MLPLTTTGRCCGQAARELNTLKGAAAVEASEWLQDARLLLEVEQVLDVCYAQAMLLGGKLS